VPLSEKEYLDDQRQHNPYHRRDRKGHSVKISVEFEPNTDLGADEVEHSLRQQARKIVAAIADVPYCDFGPETRQHPIGAAVDQKGNHI
jgi:hypothetical protein